MIHVYIIYTLKRYYTMLADPGDAEGETPYKGKPLIRGNPLRGTIPSKGQFLRRGDPFEGEIPSKGRSLRRGDPLEGGKSSRGAEAQRAADDGDPEEARQGPRGL